MTQMERLIDEICIKIGIEHLPIGSLELRTVDTHLLAIITGKGLQGCSLLWEDALTVPVKVIVKDIRTHLEQYVYSGAGRI
jgi:hypothetical protein